MKRLLFILLFIFIVPLHAQRSDFNEINFEQADRIANSYKGEDLYNLPVLAHHLTATLPTDVERFRSIYYWVTHNIKGDYDMMYKNDRARKRLNSDANGLQQWNTEFTREVFTKLLEDKTTLCTGYAYLIKELSNLAGLECEIINGYGPTNKLKFNELNGPNHSWNAIKLNGKWYLCDPTWSAGFTNLSTFLFEYRFDESLFLMEPSEFFEDHKPVDAQWSLLNEVTDTSN